MQINNSKKYELHRKKRTEEKKSLVFQLWLPILLFGSIGAITWAIRGTAGWGGVDGTVVPGLMWGILWYYLAYRNGLDARGIVLWLGLGLSLGGELGYGQYVSWIQGVFYVGDGKIAIEPYIGYFWLVMCGIGWAAPGGIVLGWALGERVSQNKWIVRVLLLTSFLVIMFAWPFIDWVSELLVEFAPGFLFPNAELGLYSAELGKHLSRTVYTNTQNFLAVLWWVVALFVALWQKDKTTVVIGLIIGGGFGIGFMQSTIWTLGYVSATGYIDWWKIWELNSGFNLGLLYAVAFYWAIRNVDKKYSKQSLVKNNTKENTIINELYDTLFLAVGGFVLLFFVGFEYFFWTGFALSLFYFVAITFTTFGNKNPNSILEKRKNISLIFSIFYLLFLMFHGGSERLGIIFELYSLDEVTQYSWPFERILLFLPVAILMTSVAIYKIWQVLTSNNQQKQFELLVLNQSDKIIDLMTIMAFIGVLSIWPAKISVFYGLFLVLAIFAFNRIERKFSIIDSFKNNDFK